ncbi:unnamed protein product, partial [Laminaria digitata]
MASQGNETWQRPARSSSRGWEILLARVATSSVKAAPRRRKKRELRSCLWLREHEPSTISDVLEAALTGGDKKARLAATGTLLAAADALTQSLLQASDIEAKQPRQGHQHGGPPQASLTTPLVTPLPAAAAVAGAASSPTVPMA